jgi:hypothetical protein
MTMGPQTIRDIAALLRIAHHIPGRVRLKLEGDLGGGLGQAVEDARRFVRSAASTPGIRTVNLNVMARSCVVEYDPGIISPTAWQDLVAGNPSEPAEALLGALAAASG